MRESAAQCAVGDLPQQRQDFIALHGSVRQPVEIAQHQIRTLFCELQQPATRLTHRSHISQKHPFLGIPFHHVVLLFECESEPRKEMENSIKKRGGGALGWTACRTVAARRSRMTRAQPGATPSPLPTAASPGEGRSRRDWPGG